MDQPKQWKKLDNAAKIFPPTRTGKDTKVFRFSCQLYESVDPVCLQQALDKTIQRFSYYRFVIRKGLFWYFFEDSNFKPEVKEENEPPCSTIYNVDVRQLLFQVSYYKKRINLEVFHALSDGTGALQFLKTLITHYIAQKHIGKLGTQPLDIDYDASQEQMTNDSFAKYYKRVKLQIKTKDQKAYKFKELRLPENRIGVIEGKLSVKQILQISHEKSCTITELLASVLISCIHNGMSLKDENKPVVISVPVNLRQFFPSESSRNFFCVINVSHHFQKDGQAFEDILSSVKRSFKSQLTKDNLEALMNRFGTIEKNFATKIVPLAIKIPVLKIAGLSAERGVTAALSNIGKIDLPMPLRPYVELFDVFSSSRKLQICLCSYEDNMVISFTSSYLGTDVQRCFFRSLAGMGAEIEISTNLEHKEDL